MVERLVSGFDWRSEGVVHFLDFLLFMPLFVEIHEKILLNPLMRGGGGGEGRGQGICGNPHC